uniref:Uncharacterized protein n=1 Tax=Oryzias latipes TaxID=8090 RepID=A0A3P9IZR6_ORYLA
ITPIQLIFFPSYLNPCSILNYKSMENLFFVFCKQKVNEMFVWDTTFTRGVFQEAGSASSHGKFEAKEVENLSFQFQKWRYVSGYVKLP